MIHSSFQIFMVLQAHIFLIIPTICLFGSAMKAIERQALALGQSKTLFARAHSFLGYVFFAVYAFQVVTGFFRPLNICCRRIAIFLHWLIGTILNYGGGKITNYEMQCQ